MIDLVPHDMKEMLLLFAIIFSGVAILILQAIFTKKKISLNPKILNVATGTYVDSQDKRYLVIRKEIDACDNMKDMQEWYREIMFYKKDFPDKDGQMDATILMQAYNDKSTRLLSNFRSHY